MRGSRRGLFTTVKSEGGLLPADFLQRLVGGGDGIEGLGPDTYHLTGGEKLNEAASRAWNRLLGAWGAFQAASKDLKEGDAGTGVTREKWLLPLFQELGYGRLLVAKTFEIEGKSYPISHVWNRTPIHLVGRNVDLDRRSPGVVGAAKVSPHGLVQEFLNRSSEHLWGFLSNGLRLRILRESKSLTRQAYVEFDLAGMMDGQIYADFALLWLLCHQSRVEADRPEQSWLERWSETARAQGTRALEDLRKGVERAIEALGRGFLAYPGNAGLREKLQSGGLNKQDYYRQLLRTVYRLIFLFVAEDRDLLLTARPGSAERDRYLRFYSADRLRTLAERRRGSPHADLWQGLRLVIGKLSSETGSPELGLPALGSFLWSTKATPDLDGCDLVNSDLLDAVRALAFIVDRGIRRGIDYKNLGAEELGSVYESLLELHPDANTAAATFALTTAAGHERKTTGSYYTPTSLIECLLDSALEPVLDEAAKQSDPERAILNLKICDPACGSGHFLIAAAHRIANRLAAIRTGDEEPPSEAVRKALRDVVGRCLYGVDLNPMAVELCKVNLWIEALEPGKPLSFLEHRIQRGNSLLGGTPALLRDGIPDDTFKPIEGDDKEYCRKFKKENKKERAGQLLLIEHKWEPWQRLGNLATAILELDAISDDTVQGQHAKQERWEQLVRSSGYEFGRLLADAWCAAFVWKKAPDPKLQYPITEDTFRRIERNPHSAPGWMKAEILRLAEEYQFFHWHLAFPAVFRIPATGEEAPKDGPAWLGGFDVVLGNPPWGASIPDRVRSLIRARLSSARRGTLDTFAAFTEHSVAITRRGGRVGLVLPDILLLKNYPDLRLHLLECTSIEQIAHWGQAFPDASIDVCTFVTRTGVPPPDHAVDCVPEVQGGSPATSPRHAIRQDVFVANKDYRFNLRLSPETQGLIDAMLGLGPRVGDLFTIREGVHSGNVRDKLFVDRADGDHCRPLIFGRDEIAPMRLVWAGKYIQLDPNRFDRASGDYFNLGDPGLYARPKILVRRTGDFVLAAPDLEGRFCSNNFFILVPREEMPVHRLIYTAAALNSPVATLYFRTIQPRTGKLFAELKITHLEDIPIPFFGDAVADEEGLRLCSPGQNRQGGANPLEAFRQNLLVRIRQTARQVASALEPAHA